MKLWPSSSQHLLAAYCSMLFSEKLQYQIPTMAGLLTTIVRLILVSDAVLGYAIHNSQSSPNPLTPRALLGSDEAQDFNWIKTWAALGDSYTAGIGAGNRYSNKKEDRECSRYDQSYPAILERVFGPSVEKFEYAACSGARTAQIFEQASRLPYADRDLVILTAGGNDLCLNDIITTCVFYPFQGEEKCDAILKKAKENLDTFLKDNIKQVLKELDKAMRRNGIVIYVLYAQFFDATSEDCAKQYWAFPHTYVLDALRLTAARRQKFNDLVIAINKAIREVVDEISRDPKVEYRIATADWEPWVREAVFGQFCGPGSTGKYPDKAQPDLQFFKPNTHVNEPQNHTEVKRDLPLGRTAQEKAASRNAWSSLFKSILYHSVNPAAAALHALYPRAPAPPGCPADSGGVDVFLGLGLPDRWGKFFHPNEIGHVTIASFVAEAIIAQRAQILGTDNPLCRKSDSFKCWSSDGRNKYVMADLLEKNYKTYCNEVKTPPDRHNWQDERVFHLGTPEAHRFSVSLSKGASKFNKEECLDSFRRIIHGCDVDKEENPLNWKFGGQYTRGSYRYELEPMMHRFMPPVRRRTGYCEGHYDGSWSSYRIRGIGWATWDHGQETLLPAIKDCLGLGVTRWRFKYVHILEVDQTIEWEATFNTPVFVMRRCFRNNRVQKNAGGWTERCEGCDG
ncbi:hypothetical protein BBP40_011096 [Aspergillus hancockii]|nr:hypothetical protein BBP40_011096 [Aspergillus hancockii]